MRCNYAGRIYNQREIDLLKQSSEEFWLTSGHFVEEFESGLSSFINKYSKVRMVNSGSSANLLAFMALTSPSLGECRIRPGDEVITIAATFPTTVAPIVQYGAIPVFVDTTIPQCNVDISQLEEAYWAKTKAVFLPHTLGNPFNIIEVLEFCTDRELFLIEDCCDAIGSLYRGMHVGTFGDIGTLSFYPAHHITTGEGGALFTRNPKLDKIIVSMRDWGRDCQCPTGKDGVCGKRFSGKWGDLPEGYDHKYVYSEFGYNLKPTEMQGAIGVAQLEKLPSFIEKRRSNWKLLRNSLEELQDIFYLPESQEDSKPSWFSFLLTIKDKRIDRTKLQRYLESKGIQTRLLFAGNIVKQPCFSHLQEDKDYRIVGDLSNTDKIMNDGLMVGVYPGLEDEHMIYIAKKIKEFVNEL